MTSNVLYASVTVGQSSIEMSSDLDDGEIVTGDAVSNKIATGRPDRIEPSSDSSRSRSDARTYPRSSSREARDRSRAGRWSPHRDDRYSRRRSPVRGPDRYSTDANAGGARQRFVGSRKEPSVHDANTRADLGRLAREAEAAAYKARTAALAKSAAVATSAPTDRSPRQRSVGIVSRSPAIHSRRSRSPGPSSRRRSRSPLSRRPSDTRVPAIDAPIHRDRSPPSTRHRTATRSPVPARDRLSDRSSQPRDRTAVRSPTSRDRSNSDISRDRHRPSEPPKVPATTKRALTAADIGRLEREKEAAAYKARVLAESQKNVVQSRLPGTSSPANRHIPTETRALESASTKARDHTPVHRSPAPPVVHAVVSLTASLDVQLANLRNAYNTLVEADDKKQSELRITVRHLLRLEHEAAKEVHRSELAQQALETISAM